jgi:TonB family protein
VDKVDPSRVYEPREVDTQPKRLSGGSAPYPDTAPKMRSGDSVSVSLTFVITEEGEVTDIKVTESGGKMVDDAVMAAVRNWKYAPGVKKGIKVKVRSGAKQTFRAG